MSKRLRFEVFKRDGFICVYCGAHPPDVMLHCDHVQPIAHGGCDDMDNLVTSCADCNLGKSDKKLSSIKETLPEKSARITEIEEQTAAYQAVMLARRERIESEAEVAWSRFLGFYGRESGWSSQFIGVRRFVEMLGLDDVLDALEIAFSRKPYSYSQGFKYFCGVCWNKARDRDGGDHGAH